MTLTIHIPKGNTIATVALIISLFGLVFGRFQTIEIENFIQFIIAIYLTISIYLEKMSNRIYANW